MALFHTCHLDQDFISSKKSFEYYFFDDACENGHKDAVKSNCSLIIHSDLTIELIQGMLKD